MREPDFSGVAKAWHIKVTPEAQVAHKKSWGYESSSISDWIVHGPYHPFWSWWYIGIVHLRNIPGAPTPKKRFPEATHEILCLSLNPDPKDGRPKIPDLDKVEAGDATGGLPGFLDPPDWVVQFTATDDEARELGKLVARAISSGQSCDSGFRAWWEQAIPTTLKHIRGEPH